MIKADSVVISSATETSIAMEFWEEIKNTILLLDSIDSHFDAMIS